MAISHVALGTVVDGTSSTYNVPYPTGGVIQAGDDIFCFVEVNSTSTPSMPAGWTLWAGDTAGGSSPGAYVFHRAAKATGSESGTVAVSKPAVNGKACIGIWRGGDPTTPMDVDTSAISYSNGSASTAYNIPTFNTTVDGADLIVLGAGNNSTGTWTEPSAPAAFTELLDANGTAVPAMFLGHLVWSSHGATGTINLVKSNSIRGVAVVVALRPAATGLSRSESDSAPATDAVSRALLLPRAVADTAAASDALARAAVFARSISDTAAATDADARSVTLPRAVSDSAPATDTVARSTTRARAESDSAGGSDSTARTVAQARTTGNSAPATDSCVASVTPGRLVADTAAATDAAVRSLTLSRSTADAGAGSDTVARATTRSRSQSDSAPATDVVTRGTARARSCSDSAPAVDGDVRNGIAFARSVADAAGGTDSLARILTQSRSTSDAALAADSVARAITILRSLADSAPAVDSTVPVVSGGSGPGAPGRMTTTHMRVGRIDQEPQQDMTTVHDRTARVEVSVG